MNLYAWVKPAFISKGSPVDHTWITSYDSQSSPFPTLRDIKNANHDYWFCHGDFYINGNPHKPIISNVAATSAAKCLVNSNIKDGKGTILLYGIDGVCHQVSNQVLYATSTNVGGKPKTVCNARGYKLSSAIFGTYGRREKLWRNARIKCNVAPISVMSNKATISLLSRRLSWILSCSLRDLRVKMIEEERRQLLQDIDQIAFGENVINDTKVNIVIKLNQRINDFLLSVASYINDEVVFKKVFDLKPGEKVDLIDPELYIIPDASDWPERNSLEGW